MPCYMPACLALNWSDAGGSIVGDIEALEDDIESSAGQAQIAPFLAHLTGFSGRSFGSRASGVSSWACLALGSPGPALTRFALGTLGAWGALLPVRPVGTVAAAASQSAKCDDRQTKSPRMCSFHDVFTA